MASRQWIEELKEKDKVEETYLVWKKALLVAKNGKPYLNLVLGDKTGRLDARVWNHAGEMDAVFGPKDLIKVRGQAIQYSGQIQLNIKHIQKVEASIDDVSHYVPSSARPKDEMMAELRGFMDSIQNPHLKKLTAHFLLEGTTAKSFLKAPAAKTIHHACSGGLLEHTVSVCGLLVKMWEHFQHLFPDFLDRDLLLTGGLLHDLGKTWELEDTSFEYTDEGKLIGHLVMMHDALSDYFHHHPEFPKFLALHLKHIILSHHGELEHGSPKRPKTPEALVIHHADLIDVRVTWLHEQLQKTEPGEWTPYQRLHGQYFWNPPRTDPSEHSHPMEEEDSSRTDQEKEIAEEFVEETKESGKGEDEKDQGDQQPLFD